MVSFTHSVALGYDDTVCLVDRSAHVGLELSAVHLPVAVDGIYLAVVVEEHAEVIDAALHVVVLPGSLYVLAGIALQSLAVDVGEDVKLTVGISDGWSPDALSVYLLMVLERERVVVKVEAVKAVAYVLPVDEVARVEDDESWHRVHCSASEVVVIAHAENVGVGELVVEERIGKRAVAVVGCPRSSLCLCRKSKHGCKQRCSK